MKKLLSTILLAAAVITPAFANTAPSPSIANSVTPAVPKPFFLVIYNGTADTLYDVYANHLVETNPPENYSISALPPGQIKLFKGTSGAGTMGDGWGYQAVVNGVRQRLNYNSQSAYDNEFDCSLRNIEAGQVIELLVNTPATATTSGTITLARGSDPVCPGTVSSY